MRRIVTVLFLSSLFILVVLRLADMGLVQFNDPSPERFPVRGIDVSHHQGVIDWTQIDAEDVDFAYIKATEGRSFEDPRFRSNWQGCLDAGLACGAYHYFSMKTPGDEQASNFLDILPRTDPQLPPVVDFEFSGDCPQPQGCAGLARQLQIFLEKVESTTGGKLIVYVAGSAHRKVVERFFPTAPIWKRSIFYQPRGPCREWDLWQFSNRSRLNGIQGFVDRNVFCGETDALHQQLRRLGHPPRAEIEEEGTPAGGRVPGN